MTFLPFTDGNAKLLRAMHITKAGLMDNGKSLYETDTQTKDYTLSKILQQIHKSQGSNTEAKGPKAASASERERCRSAPGTTIVAMARGRE